MKICPKCGGKKFIVTAHVTEDWLVDEGGNWLDTCSSCNEVTHYPNNDDLWTCSECGYEAAGSEFEMNEYDVTISYIANTTIKVMAQNADRAVDMASYELESESPISYTVQDEEGRTVLDGMF